jgi:hypothetical protein
MPSLFVRGRRLEVRSVRSGAYPTSYFLPLTSISQYSDRALRILCMYGPMFTAQSVVPLFCPSNLLSGAPVIMKLSDNHNVFFVYRIGNMEIRHAGS